MAKTPAWKRQALKEAFDQIIDIQDHGIALEMLTDYHWRVGTTDVWPSSKKFKRRGGRVEHYKSDLFTFLKSL